jgi:hypothetical protein
MTKFLITVYLIIFSTYVLFTREPDFFGSETAPGAIHFAKDSAGAMIPLAVYPVDSLSYKIDARYLFRSLAEQDKVEIIYNPGDPAKGAVYSWWGYWVTWQELFASIGLLVLLFQIAKTITRNPTPEGLLSELENHAPPRKRRRYD